MKKTSFVILSMILSASFLQSEAGEILYTYAGTDSDKISFYGKGKAERYDVCIPLSFKDLENYKIKSIRAYINPDSQPSESSVWIASSLENKPEINPQILNESVTPQEAEYAGEKFKMLEYVPSSPIAVSELPIYVGYSVDIPDVYSEGNKAPLALYEKEVIDGFRFHSSQSVVRWYDYSESLGMVPLIMIEFEGDQPENSLLLTSIAPGYAQNGGESSLKAYVVNTGTAPVKSLGYTFSVNGVEKGSATMEFNPPLVPDMATTNIIRPTFSGFDTNGKSTLSMTVTEVNGVSNAGIGPTASTDVEVVQYLVYSKPLVEEYTGMWCGWCPSGYVAMEAAKEKFGSEAVLICYHFNDALAPEGADYPEVSAFPALKINRGEKIDPYYGTHMNFDIGVLKDIEDKLGIVASASVSPENMAIEDDILKFDVVVMPANDKTNANYRIGYVITEDNCESPSYIQENYYSGKTGYGAAMQYFVQAPPQVTGLVYQDVALCIDKRNGIEGLLPSSLEAGKFYSASISVPLAEMLPISNPDNVAVAVILIDGETGEVINSEKAYLSAEAGIGPEVVTEPEVVSVAYFTVDGRRVSNPGRGIYILVNRMSDGSVKTVKKIFN